jgi:hypothetical protein
VPDDQEQADVVGGDVLEELVDTAREVVGVAGEARDRGVHSEGSLAEVDAPSFGRGRDPPVTAP